ncbi:MAG TPA: MFS transporter [Gaiellaceae bacterium]
MLERRWRTLIVVCVAIFMLLLDITIVNVALPDIQKELHTSFTDLQWVVDAYALMLATSMLNAGSLGDLLGRKRVFVSGVILFTCASAACGAAMSPLALILARGAQGIGGAIMFAVSLAILSQEFHGRERGTAFGIWGATIGAAVAIGPLAGGVLTTWAGWRWIFFVNLPIGAACVAGAVRELHESRDEERGGFDLPGFVTLSAGLFALVLGLLRGNDWGWSSGRVIGLFTAAVVFLVSFVLVESRSEEPMFDVSLFRVPTFAGAQITAFVISSAMFSQFLYLSLYLQNVLGYSPIQAGARFLPLSLLAFVAAPIAGRLSVRVPVRYLIGGGLAAVSASLFLMYGITNSSGWTTLLPGFVLGGIGIGFVNAPLASTSVGVVPPQQAGMGSGINNTFRQVGFATGIAALGALFQSRIHSELAAKIGNARASGLAEAVSTGAIGHAFGSLPPQARAHAAEAGRAAFISGLNEILLIAAVVTIVGSALAFALIRSRDFVGFRQPEAQVRAAR